jgi:predicted nucleic acid-binding protein
LGLKGIDSSLLVYALDPRTKEHPSARDSILSLEDWAINPTVVHEVYHTLVFKRGMNPGDGRSKLKAFLRDRRTHFLNITRQVSLYSLDLATEFKMGGRDSLIAGCYMTNGVETMLTHDSALLVVGKVSFRGRQLAFRDPLA